MSMYKGKYRTESNRLRGWDYSRNGFYFITIMTQHRICNLGHIENNQMILSDFGEIVKKEWLKSFEMRHELFLDEFIIMPNHIHAIIELKQNDISPNVVGARGGHVGAHGDDYVGAHGRVPLHNNGRVPLHHHRKPKSVSTFMAGFKSAINTKIDDYIDRHQLNIPKYNRKNHFFQPNYHDHIIRNEKSYRRIKKYIINNPAKW